MAILAGFSLPSSQGRSHLSRLAGAVEGCEVGTPQDPAAVCSSSAGCVVLWGRVSPLTLGVNAGRWANGGDGNVQQGVRGIAPSCASRGLEQCKLVVKLPPSGPGMKLLLNSCSGLYCTRNLR